MEIDNIVLRNADKRNGFFVFRSKENELLCRKIEDGELDGNAEILADIISTDFDAVIDKGDTLHIVAGNKNGDVTYFRKIDNVWKKATLLKLRPEFNTKTESFFIFKTNGEILVIYLASYDGRKTLCSQCIADNIDAPIVLAELDCNSSIFACQNEQGDVFVFYTDNEKGVFGNKRYSGSGEEWSNFCTIEGDGRGIQNISAECDGEEIYVCYKHKEGIHFRCIAQETEISDRQILTRKHLDNCSKLVMNCRDNLLRLFWENKSSMICTVRDNSAKVWSRLAERDLKSAGALEIFKLADAETKRCRFDCGTIEKNTVMIHEQGEYFRRNLCKNEKKKRADELEDLIKKIKAILKELEKIRIREDDR